MANIKQKPFSDEARWITIYPAYLNSKKTKKEGRRIPASKAVINPTCQEMYEIFNFEGLHVKVEKNKIYSREPDREEELRGRIRVQLRNDDGTFANEKFQNRESLMLHAAQLIPQLKTRTASGTPAPPTSQPQQSGGKKKKK
ncbi:hypothetical protein FO519_001477 [Halicephalobus sp. NKZ332]|nr:hypothetical protein FO519_001477 [Halicephalobus sp. NKZ332]